MRGKRPKPTIVKQREGNPGKRPLVANVVAIHDGPTDPPEFLDKRAGDLWRQTIAQMSRLGTYADVNMMTLAGYCQSYSNWAKAELRIRKEGLMLTTKNGFKQINPLSTVARQAKMDMLRFAAALGITPVDSTRLKVDGRQGVDGYGAEADFGEGIV